MSERRNEFDLAWNVAAKPSWKEKLLLDLFVVIHFDFDVIAGRGSWPNFQPVLDAPYCPVAELIATGFLRGLSINHDTT